MPGLKAKAIFKQFQTKKVLTGVSFSIPRGQVFGIVGPNGVGKTTLLRIFAGLLLPDQGEVFVETVDVLREPEKARKQIGFILNGERSFYQRLTGLQNLEFFAGLHGMRLGLARRKAAELFRQFDLEDMMHHPVAVYSSGQLQKLSIARALLHNPPVLLVDELSQGLDVRSTALIRSCFKEFAKGKATLLATNNLEEAQDLCDRIAFLNQGQLAAEGSPDELVKMSGAQDLKNAFLHYIPGPEGI